MSRARKAMFLDRLALVYPEYAREALEAFVRCGEAFAAGCRERDPKARVAPDAPVELRLHSGFTPVAPGVPGLPFVSRGGGKLDPFLEEWDIPVAGHPWLDAGASTGGFTHALLLRGATMVHAVDVGYNLLDWRLRSCGRVQLHERTNFLDMTRPDPVPWGVVADLSFRSLQGAASRLLSLVDGGILLALVKPQFELAAMGGEPESFDGVVRDPALRKEVLQDLALRLASESVAMRRIAPSPVKGTRGNQEYMAWLEPSLLPAEQIAAGGRALVDRLDD